MTEKQLIPSPKRIYPIILMLVQNRSKFCVLFYYYNRLLKIFA